MPYPKIVKPLAIYLVVVLLLAAGLNLFLKNYSGANYSDQKKEELITTPSKFRSLNEDPCNSSIYGDPGNVSDNYIKININCSWDNSSTNTLEMRSISPDTYLGALQLIGKINAFEVGVIPERVDKLGSLTSDNNEWRCYTGSDSEIKNFNQRLKNLVTINCFYKFTQEEVEKYYKTR